MLLKIWRNASSGKIIKSSTTDKVILCDDCPCASCAGQPTTVTATWFAGASVATLTLSTTPVCNPGGTFNARELQCFWNGTFVGGPIGGRQALIASQNDVFDQTWRLYVFNGDCTVFTTFNGFDVSATPPGSYSGGTVT